MNLETLKKYRKTIQMLSCTLALIIYSFVDLLIQLNSDPLAYISLTGLAGFAIHQSVKENGIRKTEYREEENLS